MMRNVHCMMLVAVLVLATLARGAVGAGDATPTIDDAKAAFEKADYNEALRVLARLLSLKGKAAEGLDRYEMLMLRAESQLKLKSSTGAVSALEEAVRVAKAKQDDVAGAEARALILLIKKSKGLQFSPKLSAEKGVTKEPIDITDTKKRKDALMALYVEEKAGARPKVVAADKSKDLPKVGAALKEVVPLKDLEVAASGKDSETTETIKNLVDRAHTLMAKGLDKMTRDTERIAEHANQIVQFAVTRADGSQEFRTRRQGIDRDETDELKGMIRDCKQVIDACKDLTKDFTDDTEPFEDLEDQARTTGERAHHVLTDNYSRLRG